MRAFINIVCGLFITLFLCLSVNAAPLTKKNVIVDADMDFDDLLVFAMLSADPGVNIKLVTLNTIGWTHCIPGKENIPYLFNMLKQPQVPPVACGRSSTFAGGHSDDIPAAWRQHADNLFGLKEESSSHFSLAKQLEWDFPENNTFIGLTKPAEGVTDDAVGAIIKVLESADNPVDIITLSTLTNLADLFDALANQTYLAEKIGSIFMMGGAFAPAKGNVYPHVPSNTTAEWNIYLDPVAAEKVFSNPLKLNLVQVPVNITNQVPITRDFLTQLKKQSPSPGIDMTISLFEKNEWIFEQPLLCFWDSLTALLFLNPEDALYWGNQAVSVDTANDQNSGQTVRHDGGKTWIAYSLNSARLPSFNNKLIELLSR